MGIIKKYTSTSASLDFQILLEMYIKQLEKGLLCVNGVVQKGIALNIILIGMRQKDSETLLYFLTQYQQQIGTIKEREEILNFGWASYYFLTKDFDKANEYLAVSYLTTEFIINTRRMRIKILFEQKESIALEYELDAFKVFVFRQYKKGELSQDKYKLNNHFIDLLKQINNLANSINVTKKDKLIKKIENEKCTDKEWLLEKINEVKY